MKTNTMNFTRTAVSSFMKGFLAPLAVIRSMLGIARHAEEDTP